MGRRPANAADACAECSPRRLFRRRSAQSPPSSRCGRPRSLRGGLSSTTDATPASSGKASAAPAVPARGRAVRPQVCGARGPTAGDAGLYPIGDTGHPRYCPGWAATAPEGPDSKRSTAMDAPRIKKIDLREPADSSSEVCPLTDFPCDERPRALGALAAESGPWPTGRSGRAGAPARTSPKRARGGSLFSQSLPFLRFRPPCKTTFYPHCLRFRARSTGAPSPVPGWKPTGANWLNTPTADRPPANTPTTHGPSGHCPASRISTAHPPVPMPIIPASPRGRRLTAPPRVSVLSPDE
jgi:hypothetical protein